MAVGANSTPAAAQEAQAVAVYRQCRQDTNKEQGSEQDACYQQSSLLRPSFSAIPRDCSHQLVLPVQAEDLRGKSLQVSHDTARLPKIANRASDFAQAHAEGAP